MTPENLGYGGLNADGDVVPIEDVEVSAGYIPEENDRTIEKSADISKRILSEYTGVASSALVDREGRRRVYPRTVEQVIADRKERGEPLDIEITDANADTGGGIPRHREEVPGLPLRNVLNEAYRPWQKSIGDAVKRFGLADFSLAHFERMREVKPKDFYVFCEQFYDYQQGIMGDMDLIRSLNGRDVGVNSNAVKRFGEERTREELEQYIHTLGVLDDDLEETGIPQLVRTVLGTPKEREENFPRRNQVMHEAWQRRSLHHGKKVQVVKAKAGLTVEWPTK
mgnify:CR=1 FL=1